MAKGRPTAGRPTAGRADGIEARLGEMIAEIGRIADESAVDREAFDALSRAVRELVVARERVRRG